MEIPVNEPKAYKFGLELECGLDADKVDNARNELARIGVGTTWDMSIRNLPPGKTGIEVVTPPLGYNATQRIISKVTKILDEANVGGNKTCGYHLHTSHRNFKLAKYLKRIIHTWIAMEDVMYATQPRSRHNNGYCVRHLREYVRGTLHDLPANKNSILEKIADEQSTSHGSRYFALNMMPLYDGSRDWNKKHGTIENRLHAYTSNTAKIRNWVTLNRAFYGYCLDRYNPNEVNELFKTHTSQEKVTRAWELLGLSDELKRYYTRRIHSSLFTQLATQQKSANDFDEIKAIKDKVVRRYNKAKRAMDAISEREREISRAFSI